MKNLYESIFTVSSQTAKALSDEMIKQNII